MTARVMKKCKRHVPCVRVPSQSKSNYLVELKDQAGPGQHILPPSPSRDLANVRQYLEKNVDPGVQAGLAMLSNLVPTYIPNLAAIVDNAWTAEVLGLPHRVREPII